MSVEVKRKPGESFESLFRRFKERLQKARVLEQAKKTFFREKALSERKKREAALRREEARKRREYLRRIGKLEESE